MLEDVEGVGVRLGKSMSSVLKKALRLSLSLVWNMSRSDFIEPRIGSPGVGQN